MRRFFTPHLNTIYVGGIVTTFTETGFILSVAVAKEAVLLFYSLYLIFNHLLFEDYNMDFKNVDNKYRAVPFWSWNDKLTPEEVRRQIALMDDAGIGGFMMHARAGLLTKYMSDEWFEIVDVAIKEAHARGMHPWAYDENGWPSGFADGRVLALGSEYHQKILSVVPAEQSASNVILERDGYKYFYRINPYYVDVLDKKVISKFIDEVYSKYKERCGNSFDGFFTDEPQMMNDEGGFPWSLTLEEKFLEAYGYSLVDNVDALFFNKENSKKVRLDYWHLVTLLFDESFFRQIGTWCKNNGYSFTGHLMMEDRLIDQIRSSGAAMVHYEHFSHPGIDWLERRTDLELTARQLGSAAAQMGKKQVLSESYALCGHNVSFAELRGIYEEQMVRGVNLLCTHLEGYSNKGKRKRDYPPALYFQQPWWEDAKTFFDSMARVGMILAEGEHVADTLLIHSQTAAWALYDGDYISSDAAKKINAINRSMLAEMRILEDKHILYHLGDELMMERYAYIKDGKLIIGKMAYSTVVLPAGGILLTSTEKLLEEFKAAGGCVVSCASNVEPSKIVNESHLTYTKRCYPEYDIHYFVNTHKEPAIIDMKVGNLILDIETGDVLPFGGIATLKQYESALIIDTHTERESVKAKKCNALLDLSGEWNVKDATYNSLTLDRCDYRVDGGEWENNVYVLDILPRLNLLRREAVLEQKYTFTCEDLSDEMFLVTETPELFYIEVNGIPLNKIDVGYFRDTSFRMLPIIDFLKLGDNEIYLKATVKQSDACYNHIDNSWTCGTMRNCLTFDVEIEQIYIVGNFGVRLGDALAELDRDAYRVKKQPIVTAKPNTVNINKLDTSGYPMFAGKLTLEKTFNITNCNACVSLKGRGMTSVHLKINGKYVGKKIWSPYEVDVSEYLQEGENKFELTILNNLRNMQGPFHLKQGESYTVFPACFFRENNVVAISVKDEKRHDVLSWWDDDICLVHFGLDT